jgi:hypothetical protein
VRIFASSGFAERAFCPNCGSHLWYRETNAPAGSLSLMPGLFDAAHDWPLVSEVYSDQAMASIHLAGEHRKATKAQYEAKNSYVEVEGDAL